MSYSIEDLKDSYVVTPPRRGGFSLAEVRITGSSINFSSVTAAELKYPPEVIIFLSRDTTRLILASKEESALDLSARDRAALALPFFTEAHEKKRGKTPVAVRHKMFLDSLRLKCGWGKKGVYCASGTAMDGCDIIVFDLKHATMASRGKNKPTTETFLATLPSLSQIRRELTAEDWSKKYVAVRPEACLSSGIIIDTDYEEIEDVPRGAGIDIVDADYESIDTVIDTEYEVIDYPAEAS